MEGHVDLTGIALVMVIAVFSGFALMRLRQPPIVGYILAGVVLGPSGLGLVENRGNIAVLAELGVVLLLFLIGMELSLRAFVRVLRPAAISMAVQLVLSLVIVAIASQFADWSLATVALLGFIFALSSTAVVIAMLDDIGELRTEMGRITVGVMIAQDIAIVLIESFGGSGGIGFSVVFKLAAAIAGPGGLIWFLTRRGKITLPMSSSISGRIDLLSLAALASCFAAAALSGIAGLSAVYGVFLAGLVIASSTLRAEFIQVTQPIQSVLVVIFFPSIGLLIDLDFIARNIWLVLFFVLAVLGLKSVFNVALLHYVGEPWERAFPAGLIMAQIGEFPFVLAAMGARNGVIDAEAYRLAIAVIAVSLLTSPLWMSTIRRFHDIAHDGVSSLRAALGEVYSDELSELERASSRAWRLSRDWRTGFATIRRARRMAARGSPVQRDISGIETPEAVPSSAVAAAGDPDVRRRRKARKEKE